ncbi:inactive C-alpha-formylglycine-generating enzyme 2-like [Antedon mediterranea]|uniref:inactive C-alpha-formylglycine-generating enzyme 2-like n=1 Tax=Antedon mediterranea TaxID=105859 RepID=UPI003AF79D38
MNAYILIFLHCLLCYVCYAAKEKKIPSDPEYDHYEEMLQISGGDFLLGSADVDEKAGESAQKKTAVKPFKINKYPITNAAFRKFVRAKKFKTEAEVYQWSFVFDAFVPAEIKNTIEERIPSVPWWVPVPNAYWRQPEGKKSSISTRLNYPVVHVSFNDAKAYCQWRGWRLPSEKEWEVASRGGLVGKKYPWGNRFEQNRMNIWQGKFPSENSEDDGYHGVAPVDAYPAQNDYGMFDMVGNVWEWTSSVYPSQGEKQYVLRGGSYIDTKDGSFNHMTRVTTKMGNTADSGSDNLGFRCAETIPTKHTQTPPKGKKADSKKEKKENVQENPKPQRQTRPNPADLNSAKYKKGSQTKPKEEL